MNNTDLRETQSTKWFVVLVRSGNTIKALARKDNNCFHCTIKPSAMMRFTDEKSAYKFWENNKSYYEHCGLEFVGVRELEVNYKLNLKEMN